MAYPPGFLPKANMLMMQWHPGFPDPMGTWCIWPRPQAESAATQTYQQNAGAPAFGGMSASTAAATFHPHPSFPLNYTPVYVVEGGTGRGKRLAEHSSLGVPARHAR